MNKLLSALKSAIRKERFDVTPAGVLFPVEGVLASGRFGISVNGDEMQWSKNLATTEGLTSMLDIMFHNVAQITTWYLAPFTGNVNPASSWTAANFTANATEFTAYDETTRVAYDEAAASAASISNVASKARFTVNGTATLYGAGLLSASAKSATSGKLYAATKFAASRAVQAADLIDLAYTASLTSS